MDQIKTGRFIAFLRKEANLTQEELGIKLGVSNKTVSRWENGNYMPDIETLRLLGKEFSVSMEELLDGERLSAKKPPKTPDPFTPKERADFWRRNWKQENKSWFVFWGIINIIFIFSGLLFTFVFFELFSLNISKLELIGFTFLFASFFNLCLYLYFYNKMCIYVESNAYKLSKD
jgi:transcriptional regulator with XRE-family HTH domain